MAEPKVRFKQDNGSSYPEWIEYTVADIFEKIKTKNKDCRNNNVITNSAEFGLVNQRDFFEKDIAVEGKTENYTIIKKGDFVYNPRKSSHAPMGPFNCYRLEDDGIVSPLYTCLRPKNVLNAEYLLWFFQTDKWHDYVNEHGAQNGARHDRVGMTDSIMMGIPINAPCPEEQEKIAVFLSTINELIASSEKEIEKYKELKKGCMQKMFPKEGASAPEVRFPGFTDDWEQRKLGEELSLENGYAFQSEYFVDEKTGLVVATPGNVSVEGGFICEGGKNYSIDGPCPDRFVFQPNDIFVTMTDLTPSANTLGKPAIVPDDGTTYLHNQRLGKLVNFDGDKKFLFALLCTENYHTQMVKTASGTTVRHSSPDRILSYEARFPKVKEQVLIGLFFMNLDNLITLHQRECEKYKELKKGLLQQMFV